MNARTRCLSLFVLTMLVLWASATMAQVAPTSIFQLDGNASGPTLNNCTYGGVSGQPCDYWNLLNGTGNTSSSGGLGGGSSAGNSLVRSYISGTASTDSFVGGGSKDPNDLSAWAYSNHSSPDKDTLNAGYAAAYQQGGDFELIFGADRLSPNGDANIGLWFFQNSVSLNGTGGFTGVHKEHDIFVISAFTGGGGKAGISVYEWEPACNKSHYSTPSKAGDCADTNLAFLASVSAGSACGSSAYCAITNASTTNSSWEGNLASPLFFEGGIDITYALSSVGVFQLPCFSSFLLETRSSQSTSAVLKDFLLGNFPVCGITVSKQCGTASVDASGSFINYPVTITVKNTGIGSLSGLTGTDAVTYQAGSSNNTGTSVPLTFSPSTIGPKGSGTDTATATVTLTSTGSSLDDTATATDGTGSISATSDKVNCHLDVNSTLKVSKSCNTTLVLGSSDVQVQVGYGGTVCNLGTAKITGLALKDFESQNTSGIAPGTLGSTTLQPCTNATADTCTAPASACTTYSGTYTPTLISSTNTHGRFFFNDEIVITAATPAVGTLDKIVLPGDPADGSFGFNTASCPICDTDQCVGDLP